MSIHERVKCLVKSLTMNRETKKLNILLQILPAILDHASDLDIYSGELVWQFNKPGQDLVTVQILFNKTMPYCLTKHYSIGELKTSSLYCDSVLSFIPTFRNMLEDTHGENS